MRWSDYQLAFFDAVENTNDNIVLQAYAGSGKTTTATASLDRAGPGSKFMTCFDKAGATQLQSLVDHLDNTDALTLHSLGLRTCRDYDRVHVDAQKGTKIARSIASQLVKPSRALTQAESSEWRDLPYTLKKVVAYVKGACPESLDELRSLILAREFYSDLFPADQMVELVADALRRAAADPTVVDFDDMIYFPRRFQMTPDRYALGVVDELQDMNAAQYYLATTAADRIIAVGDEHQAIYAWRAAGEGVMARTVDQLDATVLALPISYRCDRAISEYVREKFGLVEFQSWDGAGEGEVVYTEGDFEFDPKPGDFVLSRYNAALLDKAFLAARRGHKVHLAKADILGEVRGLLRRAPEDSRDIPSWCRDEYQKRKQELKNEGNLEAIQNTHDRYAVLRRLAEEVRQKSHIKDVLETCFTDDPRDPEAIVFSSVHKAKGRERTRAHVLMSTISGKTTEDRNIHYVAATRACNQLFLHYDEAEEDLEW